ncbi:MAG: hypothetical protein ABI579_01160 [Candidatus Sumerlaeota bacterium]
MIPTIESVYTSLTWLENGGADLRNWQLSFREPFEFTLDQRHLLDQPKINLSNRLHITENPERIFRGSFSLEVRDDSSKIPELIATIERTQCVCTATLRIHPPVGGGGDPMTIARGTLRTIRRSGGAVSLAFECAYPNAGKPFCRDASQLPGFEALPPHTYIPQVFGLRGFLLPPLFAVKSATLAEDLSATAQTLTINAPVEWPPVGTLQVNDEVITYRAISDDGQTFGTSHLPLTRPHRRTHDHNAAVVLLPGAELDWCAADHDAEVIETRIDSSQGIMNGTGATVHDDVDGIVATLWRAERLPLSINTSRTLLAGQSKLSAPSWALEDANNVLDVTDAFMFKAPARGAVFTSGRRILSASYVEDLSTSRDRFDLIESAELFFEFSDTPFWGAGTRLRVTIEKGAASVQFDFNRDGVLFPVPVTAHGVLPQSLSSGIAKRRRITFEKIDSTGSWANAAAAGDGSFQGFATHSSAEACGLSGRFVTERDEAQRAITEVSLHARVRNNGGSALNGKLQIDLPGKLFREGAFAIAAASTEIVSIIVVLPSAVSPSDLFLPNAVHALAFPGGGDIEVEELWIEATSADEVDIESIGAAISSLPVVGKSDVRLTYNEARIDITSFLSPTSAWDFFSGGGGYPKVTIELIDPPVVTNWAVYLRDLHWNWKCYAATSIRPTDQLWALVDGRRTRGDGTANPALVLRDLMGDEWLGNETDIDNGTFTALEDLADERGINFAAVFIEATSLGTIIGRATAQSTFPLLYWEGLWRLDAAPLEADGEACVVLPRGDWIERSGDQDLHAQSAGNVGGLSLRDADDVIAYRSGDRAALRARVEWIAGSASATGISFDSRRFPPLSGLAIDFDARWLPIPVGARLALPGIDKPAPSIRQGELAEVQYQNGICRGMLSPARETANYFETAHSLVQRSERGHAIRMFIDGRVVAILDDDGNLRIRGEVIENTLSPFAFGSLFTYEADAKLLRLNFDGGGAGSSIAFSADGNLLSNIIIIEGAAITEPGTNGVGEMRESFSVAGGTATAVAALKLDLTAVRIRGVIQTNQKL